MVNTIVKHPAGRFLYDFYGENIFRSDICNADVKLGDLLIHEGAACDAQKYAAQVFNADKNVLRIKWYIFFKQSCIKCSTCSGRFSII